MDVKVDRVEIPQALKEKLDPLGPHLCLVEGKNPHVSDVGWQLPENLMHARDHKLQAWLSKGKNYGVVTGYGLIVIEADHEKIRRAVEEKLSPTFTVLSPGHETPHFYFLCSWENNRPLIDPENHNENIGHIKAQGGMVVGPGSIHPNGKKYEILCDRDFAQVTPKQVQEALAPYIPEKQIKQVEATTRFEKHQSPVELNILQVVPLAGLHKLGDEYFGPHPIHGSDTKRNFWVNPSKNCWYCFRHGSGGGPLLWLAVEEGIIRCEDAGSGALRGDLFKQALQKAVERGYLKQEQVSFHHNKTVFRLGDFRLVARGNKAFLIDRSEVVHFSCNHTGLDGQNVKKKIGKITKLEEEKIDQIIAQFMWETLETETASTPTKKQTTPELIEKALTLLKNPKILCFIELAFREQGLVGETKNAFSTFFDMLSTLTGNPINRRWSGRSSIGKSAIVTKVSRTFPPEILVIRSGLTKKAVWHMPGSEEIDERTRALDLKGKVLVLLEESESREFLDEAKSLLSHDMYELKYEFTVKEAGGLTTYVQVLRGWPAYIGITTVPELREEQQTRTLIGTPDRGEVKYKSVIVTDAVQSAEPWGNQSRTWTPIIQEAIRQLRPLKVWIPWLPIVAEAFPTREAKSMREWLFFHSFLESITLLLQYQLPHSTFNDDEYVVAPPFILELAILIGEAAFKETITGLEKDLHDFYEHLVQQGEKQWIRKELLDEYWKCTGERIGKTTLNERYLDKLVDLGLMDVDESKKPYKHSVTAKSLPLSTEFKNILEKVRSEETKRVLVSKTLSPGNPAHTLLPPTLPDGTVFSWREFWDHIYSLHLDDNLLKLFERSKDEEYHVEGFFPKSVNNVEDSGEKKTAGTTSGGLSVKNADEEEMEGEESPYNTCWLCKRLLPASLENTTVLDAKYVHLKCYLDWKRGQKSSDSVKSEPPPSSNHSAKSSYVGVLERQPPTIKNNVKPTFVYKHVIPAEPCELCGQLAVEWEIVTPHHDVVRRCNQCFVKLRRIMLNAFWKEAKGG